MSLPITPQSLTRPLRFHSRESGFPPLKRWIYLIQNDISSRPPLTTTLTYKNTPPRKPRKSFFHQGDRGVGIRGWSEAARRRRARCTLPCISAPPAPGAGPLASLPARLETGSCYWGARRRRGVGAGRRQPPRAPRATTSSPPSGCGRGPKELEKEPGEGEKRSSISSSSSTPRKRPSSGDPGRSPDQERSRSLSALRGSARLQGLRQTPRVRGGSTPAAGSARCRGG